MPRILMRRGKGLKTPQLGPRESKFSWLGTKRYVTSKASVKRLMVRNPANAMHDDAIANQFTNNADLRYQPTGIGPQTVSKVRVPSPPVGKAAGHDKEIKRPASKWKRGRLS